MNIFVTDTGADQSARALCDLHLVKMVVETGQILSTALLYHAPDTEGLYKPTHKNHPCVVWARTCRRSFFWLLDHGLSLAEEYQRRFGREHKTHALLKRMKSMWRAVPLTGQEMPPFVYCGPAEYVNSDAPTAYRTYLSAKYQAWGAKKARWTKSEAPSWARGVGSSFQLYAHETGVNNVNYRHEDHEGREAPEC